MKGIKPSKRFENRRIRQNFVEYILALTIPEWRQCMMGYEDHLSCIYDTTNKYHFYLELDGYLKHIPGNIDCTGLSDPIDEIFREMQSCVMDSVYTNIGYNQMPTSSAKYKMLDDVGLIASNCFDIFEYELTENLHVMARYLVPSEKIIATAIEQILGRPDTTLPGGFGIVFSNAYANIGKVLNQIAERIITDYSAGKGADNERKA